MKRLLAALLLTLATAVPVQSFARFPLAQIYRSVAMLTWQDEEGNCTATSIGSGNYLTANHCIKQEGNMVGNQLAQLLLQHETYDLAVLHVKRAQDPIKLGKKPQPGDEIVMVGHGGGSPHPLAKDGIVVDNYLFPPWDEPSALMFTSTQPIPGMSGGPVVNTKGELVGITLCGFSGIGCGSTYEATKELVDKYSK